MKLSTIEITGTIGFQPKIKIIGNVDFKKKLLTDEKLMEDDVTVLVIPKAEVLNIQNGLTVTIG